MEKLTYHIDINAPAVRVVEKMIGKETYRLWTAEFEPTSDFEGGWNKGDKIYFTAVDKAGKKGGMIAEIAEHIPNKFISIHHYGVLDGDVEITEGPVVEGWGDALENYSFGEKDGITTVSVEQSVKSEYVDHFNEVWPKALRKLKEIAE